MNPKWKKVRMTPYNYFNNQYVVFDLETTIRNAEGNNPVGSMKASPFHPSNKIHLIGSTCPKPTSSIAMDSFFERSHFATDLKPIRLLANLSTANIIVGQNVKFDMLYLMIHHYDEFMAFLRTGGVIWDTMQAEYLLTNQQEKFAGLGSKYVWEEGEDEQTKAIIGVKKLVKQGMSEKYGGTDKDDKIKEFWDRDVDTPDIPPGMLSDYCQHDVRNTAIVFREQLALTVNRGQAFVDLVATQMQAIVATTMMEYNGMKFNIDTARKAADKLLVKCDGMQEFLEGYMHDEFELWNDTGYQIPLENMNANSTKQLSTMLYGGEYLWAAPVKQVDADGQPIKYKGGARAGQQKTKLESVGATIIPPIGSSACNELKNMLDETSLGWCTDEDALKKHVIPVYKLTGSTGAAHSNFLEVLLEFRSVYKDLNTYYISLMELMWPHDGCIHGNLNHCVAATGRLTSSAPNMQNMSGGDD